MKKLLIIGAAVACVIIGAAVACGAFLPMEAVADTTTAEHSEKPFAIFICALLVARAVAFIV